MKKLITIILFGYSSLILALDCENPSTTIEMNSCAKIELDKLEVKLNAVYSRVLIIMDQQSKDQWNRSERSLDLKSKMINSQRLWVKFRKADCGTTYDIWAEGTIRGQMYLGCMLDRTNKRIGELEIFEARP